MISKGELALEYGLSYAYFYSLKYNYPKKYKKIFPSDKKKNLKKELDSYLNFVKELQEKMQKFLYTFENKKADYGKYLLENQVKDSEHFTESYNQEESLVFRVYEDKELLSLQYRVVQRWEKVVNLFHNKG